MKLQSTACGGQDIFAWEVLGRSSTGFVLDIGSYNLVQCSNSYGLEQLGWEALMIDIFEDTPNLAKRRGVFLKEDARTINWGNLIKIGTIPKHMSFLSLDCDDATTETLERMPLGVISFDVITIEHDRYRVGDSPRDRQREILKGRGYDLVCGDVKVNYPGYFDGPYEDFWCSPAYSRAADRFRSNGRYWDDILRDVM